MAMIPHLDRLPLWIAFVPLGLYGLGLGAVHLRRRPLAIAGGWDWALLASAVAGLVAVGPLALLQPATGNTPWSGIMLLVLFLLFVAMGVLVSRPRLVIYNITVDQARPAVAEVASRLDPAARWAGSTVALPARRLEVRLDGHGPMRAVSIVAGGEKPNTEGWGQFCGGLRTAVRGLPVRPSPWAAVFLGLGGLMLLGAGWFAAAPFRGDGNAASSAIQVAPSRGDAHDARPR